MKTKNGKISATFHQGVGRDALELKVQVTQEEFDKMEQLRHLYPELWDGKDLELLQEARILLKQQKDSISVQQSSMEDVTKPRVDSTKEHQKRNPGLWWTIGILAIIGITMKIIAGTLEKRNGETIQQIIKNNPEFLDHLFEETVTYQGITLKHPQNWSFETNDLSDEQFMIIGNNDKDSEFSVFWTTNKELTLESYINSIISTYLTSPNCSDLEYGELYNTKINGMDAVAVDYSLKYQGKMTMAQLVGFENKKYLVVMNLIAHSNEALEKDFNAMKNSINFTDKTSYSN